MLEKKLPKHHSDADAYGDREISTNRDQCSFGGIVCTFIL